MKILACLLFAAFAALPSAFAQDSSPADAPATADAPAPAEPNAAPSPELAAAEPPADSNAPAKTDAPEKTDAPAKADAPAEDSPAIDAPAKADAAKPAPTEIPMPKKSGDEPSMVPLKRQPTHADIKRTPPPPPPPPTRASVRAADPSQSRFSAGAFAGLWLANDLGDFELGGFLSGGALGRYNFHGPFSAEIRAGIAMAGYDERVFVEGDGWWNNKIAILAIPLELGLLFEKSVGENVSFYGGPGVGFYLLDSEVESSQGAFSRTVDLDLDSAVGFYALAGLRYALSQKASLFAEAKYSVLEASLEPSSLDGFPGGRSDDFPLGEDVDLGGLSVQLGALFSF